MFTLPLSPLLPQTGLCAPRDWRGLNRLCLAGGQAEQLLPVGHRELAACGHAHSRNHLSQRSPLDPIQDGTPSQPSRPPASAQPGWAPFLLRPHPSGSERKLPTRLSCEEATERATWASRADLCLGPSFHKEGRERGLLGS